MKWLSRRLLRYVQRNLPPMSLTEKIALEAGDVWWDGELFSGKPNWQKLHSYPKPQFTAEEQAFIDGPVEKLCGMLNDWEIVHKHRDLPQDVWAFLKKERFFALVMSKEYGGLGFSAVAHSTIVSKIASRSLSAGVTVMVPNSLGPAELLLHYGTEEQKQYYLPKLAVGEEMPCFALTGIDAGSDAGAMTDKGVVCYGEYQGKKTLGVKLSWEKRYITLAPIATVLGLAFKLFDPEHLLGDKNEIGITVCLIPTNHSGVEIGARHLPLNMAFMNGTTRGKDVFIPIDWIIGGVNMAGQGWRMLMECLSIGRGISLPALSAGASKLSYRMTGAYSRIRKQFKQPIGNFEGIAEVLARIGGYTYLIDAGRLLSATGVDLHIKPTVISAMAKYQLTELCRKVVTDAMDIHGGRAVQLGSRNYIGLTYMGLPVSITVEGANILTRNLIIFGQGAMRCHPYLREEVEAANDENQERGLNKFTKLLKKHIKFSLGNFWRSFSYAFLPRKNYYQHLTRMSSALALTSDIALLTLGGDLKRKELLSARLGDVLSHLYLASAVLKHYKDRGSLLDEKVYLDWSVNYCLYQIQIAFDGFFANFPHRGLSLLLRTIIFPLGRSYKFPKDQLTLQLAKTLLEPNDLRDRITVNSYVSRDKNDIFGRMDYALKKCIEAEVVEKKLQQAIRSGRISRQAELAQQLDIALKADILSQAEIQILRDYEIARLDAIQVDEFK